MRNFAENKKAYFNYEALEKLEAGIQLLGLEVKAIKDGKCSLLGAYIIVRGNEAYLVEANISPYQPKNTPDDYDPKRVRKLLLSKKEVNILRAHEAQKGLTIIPLRLYNKNNKVKVEIAIARGKKKFDKRETLKKKDAKRDIERSLKNKY